MPTAPIRVTLVWRTSPNYGYPVYDAVSTQLIAKPNGNRYEQFSHLRRREIKVPFPPTREGRGEGKAVREVSVLVTFHGLEEKGTTNCTNNTNMR